MHSLSKIRNTLKNLPFYSEEIKSAKKKDKDFGNIKLWSDLAFFPKESKKLTNIELSKELSFFSKRSKRLKRLTKHQILQNILPFYDSAGISRREHAHKYYAETYEVKVKIQKA